MMYLASRIAVVTGLGGCSGGLGSLIVGQCFHRHPDIMQVLNGILGGLVSITAGANVMEPGFAILTGMIGGAVVFALSAALKVRSHSRLHTPHPQHTHTHSHSHTYAHGLPTGLKPNLSILSTTNTD